MTVNADANFMAVIVAPPGVTPLKAAIVDTFIKVAIILLILKLPPAGAAPAKAVIVEAGFIAVIVDTKTARFYESFRCRICKHRLGFIAVMVEFGLTAVSAEAAILLW